MSQSLHFSLMTATILLLRKRSQKSAKMDLITTNALLTKPTTHISRMPWSYAGEVSFHSPSFKKKHVVSTPTSTGFGIAQPLHFFTFLHLKWQDVIVVSGNSAIMSSTWTWKGETVMFERVLWSTCWGCHYMTDSLTDWSISRKLNQFHINWINFT